ncbi:30S ribosomal protein S9 [Desulfurivibrio alkaliphilus]|uniref:Small ribosomal subunit protein uS9 n=1 Tax=Desulfurivibrio alkaliphilus (strain DSM 19089 / UNIQEM U267 / AHT2) TaxID=589865 RepID=D6YZQ2_DESAT|nr:30S ribosomal protein S9 [Desulfurivibrio alkaliphilus]ADH85059.1 ribosomal protein S9 [Desulfurivibrio alkaliphilus AHT 2]
MADNGIYATGKRKTAVARVWLKPGSGKILVNKQAVEEYFDGGAFSRAVVEKPLLLTETQAKFDVMATLKGGGKNAQAEALRHGISRALTEADPELRQALKRAGLLTRDPRSKERKKYGQRAARASFQFSKR